MPLLKTDKKCKLLWDIFKYNFFLNVILSKLSHILNFKIINWENNIVCFFEFQNIYLTLMPLFKTDKID